MEIFTKDMTVKQALDTHPEVNLVLNSYNLNGCTACSISTVETLEQVCQGYGIPLDAFLATLNSLSE